MYRVNTTRLTPGTVILYELRPDQRPLRPDKQWRARVLHVVIGGVNVESLEAGYEGLIEYVSFTQVVRVEQRETEDTQRT